jgi:hypothetical protein
VSKVPNGVKEVWEAREKLIKEAESLGKASKVEDYVGFLRERVAKFHQEKILALQRDEAKR